jgi:anti-sigma-K factor RskA
MTDHQHFAEAVGAFALDALDPDERRAFEAHLAGCDRCQAEVGELRRVSAAMALSAASEAPPASLRARTLARATAQPQSPPIGRRITAAPVPAPRRAVSFTRLAAAAAVVAAATLGVYAWSLRSQVDDLRRLAADMTSRTEQLRDQLSAARADLVRLMQTMDRIGGPSAMRVSLTGTSGAPGASGQAFLGADRTLVLVARGLPAPRPGRSYQVWMVMPGHDPVSAGMMKMESPSAATFTTPLPPGLVVPPNTSVTVALTDEPESGSPGPTTSPVLAGVVVTPR